MRGALLLLVVRAGTGLLNAGVTKLRDPAPPIRPSSQPPVVAAATPITAESPSTHDDPVELVLLNAGVTKLRDEEA
jgi:hypothetical protein